MAKWAGPDLFPHTVEPTLVEKGPLFTHYLSCFPQYSETKALNLQYIFAITIQNADLRKIII